MPGGDPWQFWWVVGIMVGLSIGMLAFFRSKGWI
jgi:Mg2+ and Co2+ transporter CorA